MPLVASSRSYYVKLVLVRLSRSVGPTDVPMTPNSSGLVHGSDTGEKRGVAKGKGCPVCSPTRTIYSGTNRITNFNCKIDFVQLLRRLRPYAPSTPPARSELQLVRGFTKLSLRRRRRRRRTVSTGERDTFCGTFSLPVVDIKSYHASF